MKDIQQALDIITNSEMTQQDQNIVIAVICGLAGSK